MEHIAFAPCPTCGALAQQVAGEPETWRYYNPMNDTTNTTSLRERIADVIRSTGQVSNSDKYEVADAVLAALSPPALDAPVVGAVAWLCVSKDGGRRDATCREEARADYERFGRTITPLYASPVAAQAVTDGWIATEKELPPLETPVMCRFDDAEDSYVWAMMRTDDSDGWLWAMHQRGALTDVDSYEADDDYLVRLWRPFPAHPNATPRDAQGASNGR